jgi:signal transduction histidine kinase
VPSDVHLALYRIAQEALNNVVKHARASQVDVRLRCSTPTFVAEPGIGAATSAQPCPWEGEGVSQRVALAIRDDGRGFDPQSASQERLGLGIMLERAASIGARLAIDSERGKGTLVTVVWPQEE